MSTIVSAPESLFPRLEPLLARVAKPIQYVGGEVNSVVKPWESAEVRWALMYPDAYEVGQPNQGLAILYEVLNERDWILAERTYSIWPDLAALMRAGGVPQFTLDSHRPVAAFDVLGISFSTELGFTNLLEALDLAGIPLHAADRTESDPGHLRWTRLLQPEPIADFVDAVVLGDGEASLRISQIVREWKTGGRAGGGRASSRRWRRTGCLRAVLLRRYLRRRRSDRVVLPNRPGVLPSREAHADEPRRVAHPKAPLVPLAETVHERYRWRSSAAAPVVAGSARPG